MTEPQRPVYEFGPFVLDSGRRLLLRNDEPVPLAPKVLDTLLVLIEHRGRVLSKDELLRQVWGDTIVEEGGLARNVSLLRKTLGEKPDDHRYIVTVPARGYGFVADVQRHVRAEIDTAVPELDVEPVWKAEPPPAALHDASSVTAQPVSPLSPRLWPVGGAAGALVAVAVVSTAAYLLSPARATMPSRPPITSLAVLPLDNLSGDPAQEYFADGMTEALIGQLAQVRALRVVSRTSVMRFKGTRPALSDVARALGIDALIEGTVQRTDGHVRISVQLIDARTDRHIWAREYERPEDDVLKLQGDVARAVASEIRLQLSDQDRAAMADMGTVNPAAHQEYLLGRYYLWKQLDEDLVRAIDHFERATHLDPRYAAAHAGIAHAWWWRGILGPNTLKDVEPASRAAARRALELDANLPEALVSIGRLKYGFDWDWLGARDDFRRALDLDPNNLDALFFSGMVCMALGCFDDGIAFLERAAQLDPLSSTIQSGLGRILYRAHRFDEAVERLTQAVALEPRNAGAYVRLADVYRETGQYAQALAMLEKGRALRNGSPALLAKTAMIHAQMGRRAEATRMLAALHAQPGFRPTFDVAAVHAVLGDKDTAFELLFSNLATRDTWAAYTKTEPSLATLHSDPRWPVLLRRLNFP